MPVRSSICDSPVLSSLFFEGVVDLLKRIFALWIAQDISSLEKYGSILLEFNWNVGELPSTLTFCHEAAHFGKYGFENFWLFILLDRRKNPCLQFLPAWRLTRAGSHLGGKHSLTTAHNVLVLQLVHHLVFICCSSGLLPVDLMVRRSTVCF